MGRAGLMCAAVLWLAAPQLLIMLVLFLFGLAYLVTLWMVATENGR